MCHLSQKSLQSRQKVSRWVSQCSSSLHGEQYQLVMNKPEMPRDRLRRDGVIIGAPGVPRSEDLSFWIEVLLFWIGLMKEIVRASPSG